MPAAAAPKATPTARPSGMLCSVIAETSSTLRRQLVGIPSAVLYPGCRWGSTRSSALRKMPPARKPIRGGIHMGSGPPRDSSMEGASSDQKLAAIMTPAANASIASSSLRSTCLVPNTSAAPRAVTPQVNVVARSACNTGGIPERTPIPFHTPPRGACCCPTSYFIYHHNSPGLTLRSVSMYSFPRAVPDLNRYAEPTRAKDLLEFEGG
jgi:hypothetical protein